MKKVKEDFILPDYRGGCIINLVSSIQSSFGQKPFYPHLHSLPPSSLKKRNVILLLIDGMGYDFLKKHGKKTLLWKHCKGKMTSVFPSATAIAVTSLETGVGAQQHAITGWFMHLRELGMQAAVLRMIPRIGGKHFLKMGIQRKKIFETSDVYRMKTHVVTDKRIAWSYLDKKHVKLHTHSNLNEFYTKTIKAVKIKGRKLVYAYWGHLDKIGHDFGINSDESIRHLMEIDKGYRRLVKEIKNTPTTILVTADHGQMETKKKLVLNAHNHPLISKSLVMPLCGEPRVAYAYVRPEMAIKFEKYITTKLKNHCWIIKSEDAIREGWFGLGKPNPKLFDRVGDYILVMKKGRIIVEFPKRAEPEYDIGNHGGVSSQEMYVPLIFYFTS